MTEVPGRFTRQCHGTNLVPTALKSSMQDVEQAQPCVMGDNFQT